MTPQADQNTPSNYSSPHGQQGMMIEIILLITIIATLAVIAVPSIKQYNKRNQYREIVDTITPIQGLVEKCLGLERDISTCDSLEKLIPHGYASASIAASSIIESVELTYQEPHFRLEIIPTESNDVYPFITSTLTYIPLAEVVDREGRPVIESWHTDPTSGCMIAGLC